MGKTTKKVEKKIMGKGCKCDPCECCQCGDCSCDPCTCCQCGEGCCGPKKTTKKGGCCGDKKPKEVVNVTTTKEDEGTMTIVKGDLKIEITHGPKLMSVTVCCSCCDACGRLKCENPCTCKYPGIGRC